MDVNLGILDSVSAGFCSLQCFRVESGSVGKPNLPAWGPRWLLSLKLTLDDY